LSLQLKQRIIKEHMLIHHISMSYSISSMLKSRHDYWPGT
jgi:hypothetical protein